MTKPNRAITIATRNSHKTREIQEILEGEFAIRDVSAISGIPEVAETGETFEENAVLKAVEVSRYVDGLTLADDSGLEVDALSGAPGVFSARYAGDNASDEANVQKLLGELAKIDRENKNRSARFRCVIAIARAGRVLGTFTGTVEGIIVPDPRGAGGFGYDPVFVPDGFDRTFAELSAEIKNGISHRARAFQAAMPFLRAALQAS